jgi:hypothetical protein
MLPLLALIKVLVLSKGGSRVWVRQAALPGENKRGELDPAKTLVSHVSL